MTTLFSRFAQVLYRRRGEGLKPADFVVTMIESLLDDDAVETCEFLDLKPDYIKRIYEGSKPVSQANASYITTHIDKVKFEEFMRAVSDSAAGTLTGELCEIGIVANVVNFPQVCADAIEQILSDIADGAATTEIVAAATTTSSITRLGKDYGASLFREAQGFCPNDGCQEQLYVTKSGRQAYAYEVTLIDPLKPPTADNLIALCKICNAKHLSEPSNEEINRLTEIKAELVRRDSAVEIASGVKIEREIAELLQAIATADKDDLIPLGYKPIPVLEKIGDVSKPLLEKNILYVTMYFNFIKDVSQQLSKQGRLRFDDVAMQVKLCYSKERQDGRSKAENIEALVEWMRTQSNKSRETCEALIAYFIQNCEVFYEIAE